MPSQNSEGDLNGLDIQMPRRLRCSASLETWAEVEPEIHEQPRIGTMAGVGA